MSSNLRDNREILLKVRSLKKYFPVESGLFHRAVGQVKAVDGVSFDLFKGETLGLVGESGCGKTTLGRTLLRVFEPTEGTVTFRLEDREINLTSLDQRSLRPIRRHIQMIFQDPYSSLNPRMTILDLIGEPLRLNKLAEGRELEKRVMGLMEVVGLEVKHLKRYPHAFSGGQRQRIGIARALALNPKLIVADEPVSALDVSIQAQILNLLQDLQNEFDLTYVFIAHDLSVIEHISDRVAVMYVGKIVEMAPAKELFQKPRHPYSEALLASVPKPDPDLRSKKNRLKGEVANPAAPPPGCIFHPRCPYARDLCKTDIPPLVEVEPNHLAACHFAMDLNLRGVGELASGTADR